MRGVMVCPNIGVYGWGTYQSEGRRCNSLPHGLLSVATEARRAGHDVSIVDMRQYGNLSQAAREIQRRRPEFVGVGAMTVDFGIVGDLVREMKRIMPETTTVVGGVHASVKPDDALAIPEIDYIVQGEAEWTFPQMLDNCFVGYDRVTQGEPPELDMLLPIDRELVDYKNGELMHGGGWNTRFPYVTVMAGRGCPHKCNFCYPVSETMFGKKVRMRSVGHVISELKYLLRRYKPAFVDFIDDNFTMFPTWVNNFIEAYRKLGVSDVALNVASRVDTIVKYPMEIFGRLKQIGLESVNVGFESGCQRHLDYLNKGTTVEQNREAGKILKGLGLKIIANVMFGIPGETPIETMETISLMREIGADFVSPAFLTPAPGCELYKTLGKDLLKTDFAELNRHANAPKIKGVDYAPIQALLAATQFGGKK